MREVNLDRLRTLVTICDTGSFAAAARLLHLSPPAVSLHVSELESRIGAPLLFRTRGKVSATRVGEEVVQRARQLLNDARDTIEQARRQVQGKAGRVRLGASTGVIAHLLPAVLEGLARRHPEIDVQLVVVTSQESLTRLAVGSLDLAVVALPQSESASVVIEAWRQDPVLAYLPAGWSAPRYVTPAWLTTRPLILNDSSTRLFRQTQEWLSEAGEPPRPRIELNFNDAIRSLVAAGYGASLLPHETAELPADPKIQMRALRPALWRQLALAYHRDRLEVTTTSVLAALRGLRRPGRRSHG